MGGWAEWWREGAFVPPSEPGAGRGLATVLVMLSAGAVLLPAVSYAAVAGSAAEPDAALRAIHLIFPIENSTAGSEMLRQLSTFLVLAATGVTGFQILASIVHAAQSGESTLTADGAYFGPWAITRFAIAFAALVPVASPTGLNGAQVAVSEVLQWSSDTATDLGATFVAEVLGVDELGGEEKGPVGSFGVPPTVGGITLARQILESESCALVHGWHSSSEKPVDFTDMPLPPVGGSRNPDAQWLYQDSRGDLYEDIEQQDREERLSDSMYWQYPGQCGSLALPAESEDSEPLQTYRDARIIALSDLVSAVRESGLPVALAAGSVPNGGVWPTEPLIPQLQTAAEEYDSAVTEEASTYLAEKQRAARIEIVESVREQGWTAIGSLWRTLSAAHGEVAALAAEPPERTNPDSSDGWLSGKKLPEEWQNLAARLDAQWNEEGRVPMLTGDLLTVPGDESSGIIAKILNPLTRPLAEVMLGFTETGDSDPLGSMMSLGHILTGGAEAGIGIGLAASIAANNTAASIAGLDGAYQWAEGFVRPWIWWAYGIGAVYAYLLPMLPYIAVVFAALTFFFAVIELAIALPIVCLLAVRLDGREFIHAVFRPGLILVANAVLRPIFTVGALMLSYYLLPVALGLVNSTFAAAFIGSQGGFTLGFGGILVGLTLMVWLQWQVVTRVLSAVHEIPDRLLRYWGGQAADGATEGRAMGAAVGAAIAVGGKPGAPGGGSDGGGGGLPGIKKSSGPGGSDSGGGLGSGPGEGGASGITKAGGGGSDGGGGRGQQSAWFHQSGGTESLSGRHLAQAQKSYEAWAEEREAEGKEVHGFDDYVAYAQKQQALKSRSF